MTPLEKYFKPTHRHYKKTFTGKSGSRDYFFISLSPELFFNMQIFFFLKYIFFRALFNLQIFLSYIFWGLFFLQKLLTHPTSEKTKMRQCVMEGLEPPLRLAIFFWFGILFLYVCIYSTPIQLAIIYIYIYIYLNCMYFLFQYVHLENIYNINSNI